MEKRAEVSGPTARAALAEVEAGRSAAARRVVTPWWFLPLQGVTPAASLAAFSLRGPVVQVVFWLAAAAHIASYPLDRWLTGLRARRQNDKGRRRKSQAAEGALALLVVVLGVSLDQGAGLRGAAAIAGVVLGVSYVVHARRIERCQTAAP